MLAGYDNGDVKMFDLRTGTVRFETNVKNGVRARSPGPGLKPRRFARPRGAARPESRRRLEARECLCV